MQTDGFSCKTHYFSNGRENFRYSDEERTCEQKKITVKIDRENRVFFIKDILYFRSENKTVYMVMQSGETFKFSAKLDDIESEISNKMFLRIHKSYLINHVYVQCYGTDRVKMINGDIVSISKPYRGSVKQKLIQLELG